MIAGLGLVSALHLVPSTSDLIIIGAWRMARVLSNMTLITNYSHSPLLATDLQCSSSLPPAKHCLNRSVHALMQSVKWRPCHSDATIDVY